MSGVSPLMHCPFGYQPPAPHSPPGPLHRDSASLETLFKAFTNHPTHLNAQDGRQHGTKGKIPCMDQHSSKAGGCGCAHSSLGAR